jgi:hypothetical protein
VRKSRGAQNAWRLTREDLDGVDRQRLVQLAIGLDDGHVVAVNGEGEVGVAGDRDEA